MRLKNRLKLCCAALFFIAVAAIILTSIPDARAFSTGPDPGRTGAPGELTCATAECHGTARNTGPGKFSIIAPSRYEPGQTYQIIVRHLTEDLTRSRWGFQITALTGSNARAGSWQSLNDQTRIIEDNLPDFRRQYAEHSDRGAFRGQIGGASWTINWTAPAADAGPVTFYAAGNQADNNDNNTGDQIYTTQVAVAPAAPAQESPSASSLLVFNLYTSSASNSRRQDTRISITNTDPERPVSVRLFKVDGTDGSATTDLICLGPNQTSALLASDIDPGVTGYLIAVAVDGNGCPINFNSLIGDANVKLASGHTANLTAEGFMTDISPPCGDGAAMLKFDGLNYSVAPRLLALSNIPSRSDGVETLLILNRLGGDLRTSAAPLGEISGALYDERGREFAFSTSSANRQFISLLSNDFPRTTTRFGAVIPPGSSGWMRLWLTDDAAIIGAALNFNPTGNVAAFNRGHNLRKLTFTQSATLTIPVLPPSC
ncbi:MAG TPA: Reeler domain-containing protein [Blastocatellia bacterium]|nr:Reeler domain-containing protein [Blastocatellia bacterium]